MEKSERDAYNIKTTKKQKRRTIKLVKNRGMTITGMFRIAAKKTFGIDI